MKKFTKTVFMGLAAMAISASAFAQTVLLTEDFESGALPTGWGQLTSATDGGWKFGVNTTLQSTGFPITAHTKMACTNDDACNCDKSNDILYTTSLNLSTSTNVFLSYDCYYFNLAYQGVTEEAKVVASTDGGITWTDVVTVPANTSGGWQTSYANLSSLAGNADVKIGFKYNDGGGWLYGWAIDNVSVYEPVQGVDLGVSAALVGKLDPTPAFVGYSKYLATLPLQLNMTVSNLGTSPITSFDLSWTDGTNTFNQSFSGLNILPLENYSFTANDPYITLSGVANITATISNVNNGATEIDPNNNSGTYSVEGVVANPDRKYVAEEGTGTWCGWCPRGAIFMDYMAETYPDQFVGVAVHNGDVMTVAAYDAGLALSAYPGVKVYRNTVIDPSELEGDFLDQISNPVDVTLTGTAILDISNNQISVSANASFINTLSGNYNFVAVVVEDSVHGTTSQYNQSNYYAANAAGLMGGYESLSNPVPASQMYYNHVGRGLVAGFGGATGSIPNGPQAGNTYSYTFAPYIKPALWNQNRLHVAIMVVSTSTGEVLNAVTVPMTFTTTGVNENSNISTFAVYPSPATDMIFVSLNLKQNETVKFNVTDVVGKTVMTMNQGAIGSGNSNFRFDVSTLPAGVYQISVETANGIETRKFVKQ